MQKITIYIEDELMKKISRESEVKYRSVNNMINFILIDYLKNKHKGD